MDGLFVYMIIDLYCVQRYIIMDKHVLIMNALFMYIL